MKKQFFSLKKRFKSFRYAIAGLKVLFAEEPNATIHLIVAIAIICLGLFLKLSALEWMFLCLSIGLVFVCETINSAIEQLANFVSPEKQELIRKTKDLAAAAVLISAITAIIVGLILFVPKLFINCIPLF